MDQGAWRQITVRGRRPEDQTQIAQAIESLLNETLQERVGRLPTGAGLIKKGAESDHGESWPVTSLEKRIQEKCAEDVNGRPRALLLTDEPGGGKSTTARNIAWRIARNAEPFEEEKRLPVYVRLRDWEVSGCSGHALATYLGDHHALDNRPSSWPKRDFWERTLGTDRGSKGTLFLVLDGLDEVRSRTFAFDLLEEVEALARRGNVVLLTCRTRSLAAYKSKLAGFDILRLDGLSSDETQLFVEQYPGLPDPARLLGELKQERAMLQLVREPFLLDAVCYLAAKGEGALPECRSELLDKAIEQLLLDVDLVRFSWPDDNPPSPSELRLVLAKACLTLRLQEEDGQTYNLFSFSTFEDAVQAALEPPQNGLGRVLSRFFSRTRLLQLPVEPQLSRENVGSFSHSLFLDFLAAEGLKASIEPSKQGHDPWKTKIAKLGDVSVSEFVASNAHDPAWFEMFVSAS